MIIRILIYDEVKRCNNLHLLLISISLGGAKNRGCGIIKDKYSGHHWSLIVPKENSGIWSIDTVHQAMPMFLVFLCVLVCIL